VAPPTPRAALLALFLSFFVGPLLGVGFAMVMAAGGSDAWFGLQTKIVCDQVCDGCHGPVERRGGTRVVQGRGRGKPSKMYCQPPEGSLDEAEDIGRYQVGDRAEALFLVGAIVPAFVLSWVGLFAGVRALFLKRAARDRPQP
jgi:hypothetical protein